MLKNYLRIAYRNLLKSKVASFINIFGLSVAVACSIVVYLFLDMQYSMDSFHTKADRIFLVENLIDRDGSRQLWGDSPMPLAPALEADFPSVERALRVTFGGGTFQYEDKVFREGVQFVEADYFELFDFPLRYGDASALADKDAVILSDEIATKYFGAENPVGKQVTIEFGDRHLESFTVRGVAEPFPEQASFSFNILINFEKQRDVGYGALDDWKRFADATFLLLRAPGDIAGIAAGMDRYLVQQNAANDDWKIAAFAFDNLLDLSRRSAEVRGGIASGVHPSAAVVLPLIAVFLLALSCFNYMNIAVASAARRLKEIGVRKVVGSSRGQLVFQFLSENLMLCLVALLLGIAVAHFLLLPSFNTFFEGWPALGISLTENLDLWVFLTGLLLFTGLASGAYPAFFISSFSPTSIFRGRQQLVGKSLLMRTLLTFQFVLAFITMIVGVVMAQNARYQSERDWGYRQDHTFVVQFPEQGMHAALAGALRERPDVQSLAGSADHLARWRSYTVVDVRGEKMESVRFNVGFGYLETMGLRLKEGRFFDEARPADTSGAVVVNETFARNQGWTEAVGQQVRIDSTAYTVVGVVEDFHYENFFEEIMPVLFTATGEARYRFLTLRLAPGTGAETADAVAVLWKRLYPDAPYEAFFQDTVFDEFYQVNVNILKIFGFTAVMALLISCMGLFGLASQNIARRMKEISIRKVLGGTVLHVAELVNRTFLLLLGLAAVLATPLSYFGVTALLGSLYEFHLDVGPGPFVLAYALVFLTAVVTIGTQVYKIVVANPAEVLRNE